MSKALHRWGVVPCMLLLLMLGQAGCVRLPPSKGAALVAVTAEPAAPAATPGHASGPSPMYGPSLPESFRYAVDIGSGAASETAVAQITGMYRNGDWSQTTRLEDSSDGLSGQVEESMGVGGASYTRPSGEATWTRWPSLEFEASYGLLSPFTVLRLYPLADQRTEREPSPVAGAPENTFKIQTWISAETVKKLLSTGISASAFDEEGRSALEAQTAPLVVPQTINYWVGESGHVYRAAATLLAKDETDQPAPWLEATWRFWGYGAPEIAIQAPAQFQEASIPGPSEPAAEGMAVSSTPGVSGTLVVRVFSAPGVPAEHLGVTIYPSGQIDRPLDWRADPTAEFSLSPGTYDILVQMDYAQEWLKAVHVPSGETISREVVFDFGTLEIAAEQDGVPVPVEIVVYPSGDHENWVDWRSDNPATIPLRAGEYDVEIVTPGPNAIRRLLQGLVVRPGETRVETVELNP